MLDPQIVLLKVGVALACIGVALFEVGVARATPKVYKYPPLFMTLFHQNRSPCFPGSLGDFRVQSADTDVCTLSTACFTEPRTVYISPIPNARSTIADWSLRITVVCEENHRGQWSVPQTLKSQGQTTFVWLSAKRSA